MLVVIAAIAGAVVLVIAAVRGEADAGGLTFGTYFQTLIAGAVGLGAVRVAAQHVENNKQHASRAQNKV